MVNPPNSYWYTHTLDIGSPIQHEEWFVQQYYFDKYRNYEEIVFNLLILRNYHQTYLKEENKDLYRRYRTIEGLRDDLYGLSSVSSMIKLSFFLIQKNR